MMRACYEELPGEIISEILLHIKDATDLYNFICASSKALSNFNATYKDVIKAVVLPDLTLPQREMACMVPRFLTFSLVDTPADKALLYGGLYDSLRRTIDWAGREEDLRFQKDDWLPDKLAWAPGAWASFAELDASIFQGLDVTGARRLVICAKLALELERALVKIPRITRFSPILPSQRFIRHAVWILIVLSMAQSFSRWKAFQIRAKEVNDVRTHLGEIFGSYKHFQACIIGEEKFPSSWYLVQALASKIPTS